MTPDKIGVTRTGLPSANNQPNYIAMQFQDIIQFWFQELAAKDPLSKSDRLDATVCDRFGSTLLAALRRELYTWRVTPLGLLAEELVASAQSQTLLNLQKQRQSGAQFEAADDPQAPNDFGLTPCPGSHCP